MARVRRAAADPGRRFDDLFNFVHDTATLYVAYCRVEGNRGANTPGVDGLTVALVGQRIGVQEFLDDLRAALKAGADRSRTWTCCAMARCQGCSGASAPPSTLGSFLRSFTWGNVLQLMEVHRQFLAELAPPCPAAARADVLAFVDIDSQQNPRAIWDDQLGRWVSDA